MKGNIMSEEFGPFTDRLAERLKASFGPAASVYWRLKPGPVRDEILQQRDEAIASLTELEKIAELNHVTLVGSGNARQYILEVEEHQAAPAGWENVVKYCGAPRECLPVDAAEREHVESLRKKAQWNPKMNINADMHEQVGSLLDTYSDSKESREKFHEASKVQEEAKVELVGDEVFILTPPYTSFGFDNWERCTTSDYHDACSADAKAKEQSPQSQPQPAGQTPG
jgi:hypothetical protein